MNGISRISEIARFSRVKVYAAAILVAVLVAAVFNQIPSSDELFGVNDLGPTGDEYGPVNSGLDQRTEEDLREYVEHGGHIGRRGSLSQAVRPQSTAFRYRLGPSAASMLESSRTASALQDYAAHARPMREQMSAKSHLTEGHWHPNRVTVRAGDGSQLLQSRSTQEALHALEAHRGVASHRPVFPPAGIAGRQLPALAEQVSEGAGETPSSTFHAKVLRAQQEADAAGPALPPVTDSAGVGPAEAAEPAVLARGRRVGGGGVMAEMRKVEEQARELRRKAVEARRAAAAQRTKEAAERRESKALFVQAEAARRHALKMATSLLAEKKRAALFDARYRDDGRRATAEAAEAKRLAAQSLRQKQAFLQSAGPVHKAEAAVRTANRAYNTAVMQLAEAETRAEALARSSPGLEKAAMVKVVKYRLASERMQELVGSATRRLDGLEARAAPAADLVSHYHGPRLRAKEMLLKAARTHAQSAKLHRRAAVLLADVRSQTPTLHAAIKSAERLRGRYDQLVKREAAHEASAARLAAAADAAARRARGEEAGVAREDAVVLARREAYPG